MCCSCLAHIKEYTRESSAIKRQIIKMPHPIVSGDEAFHYLLIRLIPFGKLLYDFKKQFHYFFHGLNWNEFEFAMIIITTGT